MKKRCSLLFRLFALSLLLATVKVSGQNNYWAFGVFKGLNFNTEPPAFEKTGMAVNGACASISDSSGKLLFYTDGTRAFNRSHKQMPNKVSSGFLEFYGYMRNGVIIVPWVGTSKYFVFLVDGYRNLGKKGLCYGVIDMEKDSGKGDVIQKNIFLLWQHCSTVSATKMADGNGYWLVTRSDSGLYAFPITKDGVGIPVKSSLNEPSCEGGGMFSFRFSMDSKFMLSLGDKGSRTDTSTIRTEWVYAYDFDNLTGKFTNQRIIEKIININATTQTNFFADAVFSPNDSLFYVLRADTIIQYQRFNTSIIKSKYERRILNYGSVWSSRLAPNGKIYLSVPCRGWWHTPAVVGGTPTTSSGKFGFWGWCY